MSKIDKSDLENISLIKKEFKLKNITTVKIKKGTYEIELSSSYAQSPLNISSSIKNEDSVSQKKENKKIDEGLENMIKSPMVGVAYLSADPASPPYIKKGQHIKEGETLLLIEAMKTFNEVKAPRTGVVKKIIILNSQPVEFGEDLLILE